MLYFKVKYIKFDFSWGYVLDPTGGAHNAPQTPFRRLLFLRDRREGKGKGKKRGRKARAEGEGKKARGGRRRKQKDIPSHLAESSRSATGLADSLIVCDA